MSSLSQKSTPDTDALDMRAVVQRPAWQRWLFGGSTWVLLLDVVLVIFFTALSPGGVFISLLNVQNILLNGAEALLLAMAAALLLAAGQIDLSLGANLVFSSVVGAIVIGVVDGNPSAIFGGLSVGGTFNNVPIAMILGLLACLITGVLFGLANGAIITYLKVNSLIATLATMSIGSGVVLIITGGSDIGNLPPQMQDNWGLYRVFGLVPLPALVAIVISVGVWAIIRYLKFGLYTLAIGSSRVSAERAGIRVNRHIIKLAMFAGGLAGLAGFVDLGHFGATSINSHVNDPLAAITAAVIGGAALAGGRVSIIGTVWGALLALVLLGGLVVIGTSAFYQLVATGAILVIAVAVDQFRQSRTARR